MHNIKTMVHTYFNLFSALEILLCLRLAALCLCRYKIVRHIEQYHAKLVKSAPCSHHNNNALIKKISLFDTALVMMTNTGRVAAKKVFFSGMATKRGGGIRALQLRKTNFF